jgi:transposase
MPAQAIWSLPAPNGHIATTPEPCYDPKLVLGVLVYAYCVGGRSSRQIERRCVEDIAFRVLAGNQAPDHVTIARFRVRHEQALAGFLVESLKLCAAAGMVRLGLVALDGTKITANAAAAANRTHAHLVAQVAELRSQAAAADRPRAAARCRGEVLPQALAGRAERLARLCNTPRPCRKPRRSPPAALPAAGGRAGRRPGPWPATPGPHPAVSRRTGIPAATLRTWERRYGLIRPARPASGYRRDGEDEILRSLRVRHLREQGSESARQ